jgi:hypothetical protein
MLEFKNTHTDWKDDRVCETVQLIVYDDETLSEVMQSFRKFLLAVGYHPESINEYIEAE